MASLPVVAIIGRPNTGKSTLFNRLARTRKAIECDIPGTTRDHVSHRMHSEKVDYLLIDTGGMGTGTDDTAFEEDVFAQSMLAIAHADVIVFLVSSREELTTDDHKIIDILRKKRRKHVPVILVISKADDRSLLDTLQGQYFSLGIAQDIIPVSAVHLHGTDELEATIERTLLSMHFGKSLPEGNAADRTPRIAIVGKPNVGKSSIVNAMMAEPDRERSPLLVSPIAGTTRDAVDTTIHYQGKPYVLVDTAGLKKHARTTREVEQYATMRTIQAIAECDIALLVLDGTAPLSQQDKRIAGMVIEAGKGLILLVNKSDAMTTAERKKVVEELPLLMPFCKFASVLAVSAKTKTGLLSMFELIEKVQRNRLRRISTPELRRWFQRVVHGQPMGEIARCKFITQADEIPPTFVLFVKNPSRVGVTQLRFMENRIRETFGFEGTPIRWITKSVERETA